MRLPRNISFIEHLKGRDSGTEGIWETLLVQVENETPAGLHSLTPKKKYIVKRFECTSTIQAERLWSRLRFLRGISHPNIAAYHGTVICRDDYSASMLVVCDVYHNGSLLDWLLLRRASNENSCRSVQRIAYPKFPLQAVREICEGLVYLHETMQITHGNIRPSNILMDSDGVCRLTDVGLRISACLSSEAPSDPLTGFGETKMVSEYSPPEHYACDLRCSRFFCSPSGDMFAVGCVLIELLTCTLVIERSKKFGVDLEQLGIALDQVATLHSSNSAAFILSSELLQRNSDLRPSSSRALNFLNRKAGAVFVGSKLSTMRIAVEPFIVPRVNPEDEKISLSRSCEMIEDGNILSFFENVWGQEASKQPNNPVSVSFLTDDSARCQNGTLSAPNATGVLTPKKARKNYHESIEKPNSNESQQASKSSNLPSSVVRAKNSFFSTDEDSMNRRKALSLRLCADALELERFGKLEEAESKFKTAIAASPAHTPTNVLYEYGNFLLSHKQDIKGAEAMWQRGSDQDPKHIPSLYALAKLRANFCDDVEGAEEILKIIIGLEPRHADALRSYGLLLASRGQDVGSEFAFKNSLKADPRGVETLVAYGWFLHKQGRIDEAENLYLQALSRDENNHRALSLLALLHQDSSPPAWSEVNRYKSAQMPSQDVRGGTKGCTEKTPHCTPRALESRSLASLYLEARKPTLRKMCFAYDKNITNSVADPSRSSLSPSADSCEAWPSAVSNHLDSEFYREMQLGGERASHVWPYESRFPNIQLQEPPTPPLEDEDSACSAVSTPRLDVKIERHRTAGVEPHTEYCLECTYGDSSWQVWRRFSEFHQLHSQVVLVELWRIDSCDINSDLFLTQAFFVMCLFHISTVAGAYCVFVIFTFTVKAHVRIDVTSRDQFATGNSCRPVCKQN